MTPSGFDKVFDFMMYWETGGDMVNGGHNNRHADPGGETKWGISKRSYPHLDIASLVLDGARHIYMDDYWRSDGPQRSCCDQLPWPLNAAHFDCTVNVGNFKFTRDGQPLYHGRANMILQRALGVDDDGMIGPVTLAAIQEGDPLTIARAAIQQRDFYYSQLGRWADEFRRGWHRRTNSLRDLIEGSL